MARELEMMVNDHLAGQEHIDRVSGRAKDPDRFAAKAANLKKDGSPRYPAPLTEMQDLIGVRVVVFYKNDVAPIDALIQKYLRPIGHRDLVSDSEWEFGYFGRHMILPAPGDVIPEDVPVDDVPRFFELQIKTLFQHAWSEAEHNLGYKAPSDLSSDQQRQLAFTAAQAWGANEVFDRLCSELFGE